MCRDFLFFSVAFLGVICPVDLTLDFEGGSTDSSGDEGRVVLRSCTLVVELKDPKTLLILLEMLVFFLS